MNIKFVFPSLFSMFVFASFIPIANADYSENDLGLVSRIDQKELDEVTQKFISETKYDEQTYPWIRHFHNSLREITKLALKEKLENDFDSIKRVCNRAIGNPSNENYSLTLYILRLAIDENLSLDTAIERVKEKLESSLDRVGSLAKPEIEAVANDGSSSIADYVVAQFILMLMTNNGLSLEDAIVEFRKILEQRFGDIKLFIAAANIQDVLDTDLQMNDFNSQTDDKKDNSDDSESLESEISAVQAENDSDSVVPPQDASSTQGSIDEVEVVEPAKNLFELFGGDANVDKLLSAMPAKYTTLVEEAKGSISNLLENEQKAGNNPAVINWLVGANDNGGVMKIYVPDVEKSLQNHSREGNSNRCLYSSGLKLRDLRVDLISSSEVTDQNFSLEDVKSLIMMQYFFALATGHDVVIFPMSGFNVSKEILAKIGEIYEGELLNPLFSGRLKKIIFVTGS